MILLVCACDEESPAVGLDGGNGEEASIHSAKGATQRVSEQLRIMISLLAEAC
jgi:hypothetical protein